MVSDDPCVGVVMPVFHRTLTGKLPQAQRAPDEGVVVNTHKEKRSEVNSIFHVQCQGSQIPLLKILL